MSSPSFPFNNTTPFPIGGFFDPNSTTGPTTVADIANSRFATADESYALKATADNFKKVPFNADSLGLGKFIQLANAEDGKGVGSLAEIFKPKGKGMVNILKEFPWTVSKIKDREDVPYIELKEHIIEGGKIQKQFEFYTKGFGDALQDFANTENSKRGTLAVYDDIFIRNPSGWRYKFPYFTKTQYELATQAWEKFDKIGSAVTGLLGSFGKSIGPALAGAFQFGTTIAETAAKFKYPVVGIADRPRIFTEHAERSISIQFPLFNTFKEMDWVMNREFLILFQSQNLFNKRNFATGLPPVWYEVYVPNQYYSVASCVTNFRVENLGNIRKEMRGGKEIIVPDGYQVEITLQEMAMPSKNQFHSALGGVNPFDRVNATEQQTTVQNRSAVASSEGTATAAAREGQR